MEEDLIASVFQSTPDKVAQLVAAGQDQQSFWTPDELGQVLHHQLVAPLEIGLPGNQTAPRTLPAAGEPHHPPIKSLAELFNHPNPPLQLLEQAKEFAKSNREHPESPLPPAVATVIYFAAIIAAFVHCGKRITTLSDEQVGKGVEWVLAQPWLDPRLHALFLEAQRSFAS